MTTDKIAVPPSKTLQAMLRKITETLARELAAPTQTVPEWSDMEWNIARAVAAMHGISPLLSRILRWRGPAGWRDFLDGQRDHTATRHLRIDALLRRIDRRAIETGIAAVALKGAALHEMGLYQCGDRPMADIDLLVRPPDADGAARMLHTLGFHEVGKSWKERVFHPVDDRRPGILGEHSDNVIKIELHERICEKLPARITDASELIFPGRLRSGLNPYPSKSSLMLHLLLHAAGSMPNRALRMLQLHDLALLSAQMAESDWEALLANDRRGSPLWWAYPPLMLTSRYYSSAVPAHVLAALAHRCPYLLSRVARRATLHGASHSYLWVDAFPGIAWSQSPLEVIEYAAGRLRPDAGHLMLREYVANSQAWMSQGNWSRLSQGRRVLRWLSSRQTRPATMHSVAAALAQAP